MFSHLSIPYISPVPGPWGWLSFLLFATFVLHLIVMNAVVGLVLISCIKSLRGQAEEAQTLLHPLPKGLAFVVNFGVPPFLFLQALYGAFSYSSSILLGLWWLGVMFFVMFAYYGLYISTSEHFSPKARLLALGVASTLLLTNAFVFVSNTTLLQHPEQWGQVDWAQGLFLPVANPQVWARYLHIVLACLAVGGLCLAVPACYRLRILTRGNAPLSRQQPYFASMREGFGWFFYATLLQIPVGSWFLFSLSAPERALFMGKDPLMTGLFALGLGLAVLALVAAKKCWVILSTSAALLLVGTMAGMRTLLRDFLLQPMFSPVVEAGLGGPIWFFLLAFAATLAGVIWMLRIYRHKEQTPNPGINTEAGV